MRIHLQVSFVASVDASDVGSAEDFVEIRLPEFVDRATLVITPIPEPYSPDTATATGATATEAKAVGNNDADLGPGQCDACGAFVSQRFDMPYVPSPDAGIAIAKVCINCAPAGTRPRDLWQR